MLGVVAAVEAGVGQGEAEDRLVGVDVAVVSDDDGLVLTVLHTVVVAVEDDWGDDDGGGSCRCGRGAEEGPEHHGREDAGDGDGDAQVGEGSLLWHEGEGRVWGGTGSVGHDVSKTDRGGIEWSGDVHESTREHGRAGLAGGRLPATTA